MQQIFLGTPNFILANIRYMSWHERLKLARERAGIKKIDFAQMVDVKTSTTTDWENGEIKSLNAESLLRICDVLKISPYWLMRGDDPNFSQEEVELMVCFRESTPEGKAFILRAARQERNSG